MELEGSYTEDEMNYKEYKYFISHAYFINGKFAGYREAVVSQDTPITFDTEAINQIKNLLLKENPDWTEVTILNWMRFEED